MALRPGQAKAPSIGPSTAAALGAVTNGANDGAGTGQVFRNKVGTILHFRTLIAGPGCTITTFADTVQIEFDGDIDGGFANSVYLPDQVIDGGSSAPF